MIDRGIDIARERMSNPQKHVSIRKGRRVLDAPGEFRDSLRGLSQLKVSQSFLKMLSGFDRYCRGRCALPDHRKFHEFSFF